MTTHFLRDSQVFHEQMYNKLHRKRIHLTPLINMTRKRQSYSTQRMRLDNLEFFLAYQLTQESALGKMLGLPQQKIPRNVSDLKLQDTADRLF